MDKRSFWYFLFFTPMGWFFIAAGIFLIVMMILEITK